MPLAGPLAARWRSDGVLYRKGHGITRSHGEHGVPLAWYRRAVFGVRRLDAALAHAGAAGGDQWIVPIPEVQHRMK